MTSVISPKISLAVCMITYNHEAFIAEAIEGVLMQRTSFPVTLFIGEDQSTDTTRSICQDYKKKYPDRIQLILRDPNIGMQPNFIDTLKQSDGKYIALCEGDDYWTDPYKLQKQVDFLEANQDYSTSTHRSSILHHNGILKEIPVLSQTSFTTNDLIQESWGIMTASIVFRKDAVSNLPIWFSKVKNGDYALQLLLSTKGKIGYMEDIMSVYRKHPGGVSAKLNTLVNSYAVYDLLNYFDKDTGGKYRPLINKKLMNLYKGNLEHAQYNKLKKQELGLSIIYRLSLINIDIVPLIRRMTFLSN